MRYTPHTEADLRRALEVIGVPDARALFADVPPDLLGPELDLPPAMDEVTLTEHVRELASRNRVPGRHFLGGGCQTHFRPAVVDALALQSKFVTSYTPYQPEVAQGILQAMFEFQSVMVELTGLDVSNASLYDGASAAAEAALLALRQTGRDLVAISEGVHPEYRQTVATYLEAVGARLVTLPLEGGLTPVNPVPEGLAALIVQNPNFLGSLEAMERLCAQTHARGGLFVAVVDPLSLAVLKAPGEYGADVAVGDGQTLGNAPNFGGPAYGFMVVREALLRQLPGRLSGATRDTQGRRAFVLTLQAREQHIRRAKAKSNICSNHQLMALQSLVQVCALGPAGLREAATVGALRAHQLADRLESLGLRVLSAPFFNEFAAQLPVPAAQLRRQLAECGLHAAVPVPESYRLGQAALFCCTELTRAEDLELLSSAVSELLPGEKRA